LDVQNSLAATLMILGLHYFNRGDTTRAADYYERATVIQERLYLNHPGVTQYRTNRLEGLLARALLDCAPRQVKPGEEKLDRAQPAARELVKAHPDDLYARAKLAEVHNLRCKLFEAARQPSLALAELREEFAVCEALVERGATEHKRNLAACCCNLGNYLWGNDREAAFRLYDRGVKLSREALQFDPLDEGNYEPL